MHISDMLGQYNRNVSNGTEELRSVQGVQKLVSTVGELSAGSVFEGTVNAVKGGKVTLTLGNGQVISARLDGKVDMKAGTAMFFQVKANDGLTVSIRPYSGVGNTANPILLDALTAAQVPVTERGLTMVDAMMHEQMPVDRQSILNMIKILNDNPNANVQTIVQMVKLGLPVTEIMASQFEHYLSDQHALLNELDLAITQITGALGEETMTQEETLTLYNKLVDIFLEGSVGQVEASIEGQGSEVIQTTNIIGGETLGSLLSGEQLEVLGKTLQEMPVFIGNPTLFVNEGGEEIFVDTMQDDVVVVPETTETVQENELQTAIKTSLNKDLPVSEFLRTLQGTLTEHADLNFAGLHKFFGGKEFQMLLRNMIEQQWLIRPEDLKEDKRLINLYEKMERQIVQLELAMKSAGITQNSFLQTAAEIHGNIEFMNQMNQIYNYVQIPLKMSGQNANGELYVYTNKKNPKDPEAELTAFLHLDMENLGATDVSVRMRDRKVKTNFYFEDDTSYQLVQKHLPILEKHLKNKGYDCMISITNEKRGINFKENFLKKGNVSAGSVHRYSFDVRA